MGFDIVGVRGLPATGITSSSAALPEAAAVNNTSRPLSSNPESSIFMKEDIKVLLILSVF